MTDLPNVPSAVLPDATDLAFLLDRDYRDACTWFGFMPFEEFASGYLSMNEWCCQYRQITHAGRAA